MGHRVKGYRRNAVRQGKPRRQRRGWIGEVNPPGKDGWESSGAALSEQEYGRSQGYQLERVRRVEEVRKGEGYDSNGRGRKGNAIQGYVVYGEVRKVQGRKAEKKVSFTAQEELLEVPIRELLKEAAQEDGLVSGSDRVTLVTSESQNHPQKVGSEVGIAREEEEVEVGVEVEEEEDGEVSQGPTKKERKMRGQTALEAKREHRVRRYEASLGRKVRREREDRSVKRVGLGRKGMRGQSRRRRAMLEQTHRQKWRPPQKKQKNDDALTSDIERVPGGALRTEALAVVLTRVGVIRRERRIVKRRVRKREAAGREHRKVLKEWNRRRKANGKQSSFGWRKPMKKVKVSVQSGDGSNLPESEGVSLLLTKEVEEDQKQERERVEKREKRKKREEKFKKQELQKRKEEYLKAKRGRRGYKKHRKYAKSTKYNKYNKYKKRGMLGVVKRKKHRANGRRGGYYGYRVTVTGTLNGSRRTKRWVMGRGARHRSKKAGLLGTAEGVAKTSVGTRGVQVTYCYS